MNKRSIRTIAGIVQVLAIIGLGYWIKQKVREDQAWYWTAALWSLFALAGFRIAYALKRGYASFKQQTADGISLKSVDAVTVAAMPPWMQAYYTMEKLMYRNTWQVLRNVPASGHGAFSCARGPRRFAVVGANLSMLTLAGAAGVLLALRFQSPTLRVGIIAVAILISLYGLVWIVGERRSIANGGIMVSALGVTVDIGVRARFALPFSEIDACAHLDESTVRFCARHQINPEELLIVSPSERPNVVLTTAIDTTLSLVRWGVTSTSKPRYIAFYTDQPAGMFGAINAHMRDQQAPAAMAAGGC